ncbi:hypothetical protein SBA5_450007 [Candidatus Sulfotelmatomonas gaucii]|uniref:Alpha-L-rhamnosidase six-hairpin glycosidase domain-containing protein n=1 Tax=Candidatus Sulfuritelmatomonas gaucii TaxID=2043161 RepID=A0A2N9LMM7_9BACT|nr:hypothetical protein SBA5_450007 [Candidatus Sulfotelmatomonas gaucii]
MEFACPALKFVLNRMRTSAAFFSLSVAASFTIPFQLPAQMVSPSIDQRGQPFSYYSKPTDEIGVMGAEAATEVTPEGYLRTGFEELMFFSGPEFEPTDVRIRTLEQGHLPIIHYEFVRDGIAYRFTVFEARIEVSAIDRARQHSPFPFPPGVSPASGLTEGPLVNFIRVEMQNETREPNRAIFAAGTRYDGPNTTSASHGDNRFTRPVEGKVPGDFRQIGEEFNPNWMNSFDDGHFFRLNRELYGFPAGYADRTFMLRDEDTGRANRDVLRSTRLDATPTTPIGIVTYSRLLKPGETMTLDFKMPLIPTADPFVITAIDQTGFDDAEKKITTYWNDVLAQGMQIDLPEPKVVNTFYTNLVYDLIAIDHIGSDYIQTVNKLHYHAFWLRDGADIVHSYDVTGYPQVARECLDFFAKKQQPDGNFLSQSQQYDGWGEAVWAYSQHYRITHDKAFAEWALPQIDRAVDWLHQARAADPLHIVPASNVRDNEFVPGHLTGYNFLALDGLRLAIQMANETGHTDLAQKWQAEYDDLSQAFFKVLDAQAAAHNGYIPPALDGQAGGYDWGNLLSVVPEPTLDPQDARVTATLKATQAKYAEGIMTYADGKFLHDYLTIKNTMTETIRGDQEQAVNELYALLVHTSSTNAGFEYNIRPWGDRNFGNNLAPHGWFAAEYRTLLRTMLVREQGDQLHLFSVMSPAWIGRGKTIAVRQARTNFGSLAFTLTQPQDGEALLHLDANFTNPPAQIVVHLPWFMDLRSATADGKTVRAANGAISVPAATHTVDLHWTMRSNTPRLSYNSAVAAYEAEYARRYDAFMHGGATAK